MKQQDKLRKSLREHYDNLEQPYREEDWQQASAMLTKERAKRKRRRLAGIFLFGMVVLSGMLSLLFNTDVASTGSKKAAMAKTKISTTQESEKVVKKNSPIATPIEQSETHKQIFNSKKNEPRSPENNSNGIAVKVKVAGNSSKELVSAKSEIKLNQEFKPANESTLKIASQALQTAVVVEENTSDPKPEDVTINEVNTEPEKITDKQQFADPAILPLPAGDTAQVLVQSVVPAKAEATQTSTALLTETIDGTNASQQQIVAVSDNSSTKNIAVNDSLIPSSDLMREGIIFEAGANWFYGWKNSQRKDASGISPMAAVHYMTPIGKRAAFSFGVAYVFVPQLATTKKTSREYSYVYGEQTNVTEITPSSVHYLMTPLRYYLHLNSKNSLGIGLNLAYLFNVQAKVHTYTESPGARTNDKTEKLWGYTEGISKLDAQLALCYRRRIASRLALQTEVFVGLIDVKQDDFFKLNAKERNSGAKLSLIYYAFKK